jgi:protein tyrosine phosphatase (PTP) superfamily phosphohydrolase (DUF442 family)
LIKCYIIRIDEIKPINQLKGDFIMTGRYFSLPLKTTGLSNGPAAAKAALKYPRKNFTILFLSVFIIVFLSTLNHIQFFNLIPAQPAAAAAEAAKARVETGYQNAGSVNSQAQIRPAASSSEINIMALPAPAAPAAIQNTSGQNKPASPALAVPRNDINGLKNFAKVSDVLYRGEQPTAEGFRELKKMGVKTVLSLRAFHSDRSMLKGLGMYYKRMGIYTWDFKDDYVVKFLKLVTNPEYQPVFIHCQHGADRTGTMCAIYRCAVEGWKMDEAIKEMHNFGFHKIWSNLKKYLNSIEPSKIMTEVQKAATLEAELVK